MEAQPARASRLDHIADGLKCIEGTLELLKALGSSEKVLHPETQRDQWLSKHLDHSFSKEPDWSDLPSIMEVVSSRGLHYTARMYEVYRVPDALLLKTRFRMIPSFLSRSPGTLFWATFVEGLEGSKGLLLALLPSPGQALSNQTLFDGILEDARHTMALDLSTPLSDSEDDE